MSRFLEVREATKLLKMCLIVPLPALGVGKQGGRPGPEPQGPPTLYVYGVGLYCVGVVFWSLAEVPQSAGDGISVYLYASILFFFGHAAVGMLTVTIRL